MEIIIVGFVVAWVIFIVLAGVLAANKRRNVVGWIGLVMFFSPLVILILLALRQKSENDAWRFAEG